MSFYRSKLSKILRRIEVFLQPDSPKGIIVNLHWRDVWNEKLSLVDLFFQGFIIKDYRAGVESFRFD